MNPSSLLKRNGKKSGKYPTLSSWKGWRVRGAVGSFITAGRTNTSEWPRRPRGERRGALLERFTLLFEFSFGEGGGFLHGFLDAAGSRFWSAVIENREQVTAT